MDGRRLERGGLSVRTRSGYERLRSKYQARVRLLQDGLPTSQRTTDLENGSEHEDSDGEPQGDVSDWDPIERLVDAEEAARVEFAADIEETEEQSLMNMIGVFFDARVKRFISDVCWPLAHYGGEGNRDHAHPRRVSEWRELEQDKYFAVMLKVMVWLFPGLPAFKAQEQAERDWQKDCEFDSYGAHGLSFEGFTTSLLDLATACTDGTVDKCLEFLRQMAKRLQTTLPVFRIPTNHAPMEDGDEGDENDNRNPLLGQLNQEIVWLTIPLEKLSPHMLQTQVQFFEIKACHAKLSASPLVLMFLVGEER
ncbi:TPA: hypothetical protein N0F65_008398 [Lagenidium giganteum]|uniref:Uncharacterized protein n=1 Tax=Lagenidium giganteum TaxID=4803 RepID=A0AAV2YZ71_9STRA|nr:TPA: hypothetical protein N0F65_008398 [Lagenidium giganteum]